MGQSVLTNEEAGISPIAWRDNHLVLLDQRRLPADTAYLACRDAASVVIAIKDMVVRGAPAIGITAAYGAVLAAGARYRNDPASWRTGFADDIAALRAARPTAVNLMWALDRMVDVASRETGDPVAALLATAEAMHARDLSDNRAMGEFGAALIESGSGVLTHCNAGALATAGYGTALGVIRAAWARGAIDTVYATETRPWLQGARLTAWELLADGIDVTLIADGAAAHLMKSGRVQWVITGADRIAANGDTANKIGTYGLATLARAHGVGMMVAAPLSTIDLGTADGSAIPIETRDGEELTHFDGRRVAALGAAALNPVFDVTPADLIDVLVTEKGAVPRPGRGGIKALFEA